MPAVSVLFHRSLFLAAAAEPLILLPHDDIGFDPARFRRRVLELTAVQGSAYIRILPARGTPGRASRPCFGPSFETPSLRAGSSG